MKQEKSGEKNISQNRLGKDRNDGINSHGVQNNCYIIYSRIYRKHKQNEQIKGRPKKESNGTLGNENSVYKMKLSKLKQKGKIFFKLTKPH